MCCEEFDPEFNDCNSHFVIREYIYANDYWDYDVDSYLEKGWFINDDGLSLSNSLWEIFYTDPTFPTRYRLDEFKLSKSLRRVLKKNSDLKVLIRPFRSTKQKEKLYAHHLQESFETKPKDTLKNTYRAYRYEGLKIMEVSVFKGRKLLAGSIFIVTPRGVLSHIGFWDVNEYSRSLGTLTVLLEMQYAIRKKKKFYYLGYYYIQNDNFAYKTRFPALELWDWGFNRWVDYKDPRAGIMLSKPLPCKDDIKKKKVEEYIKEVKSFFASRTDIVAKAIIGNHSRTIDENNWQIQFLFVTAEIQPHLEDNRVICCLGRVSKVFCEQWGDFKTKRVLYNNSVVLEFNFIEPDKLFSPVNDELYCLVKDGLSIIDDSQGLLANLQNEVSDNSPK